LPFYSANHCRAKCCVLNRAGENLGFLKKFLGFQVFLDFNVEINFKKLKKLNFEIFRFFKNLKPFSSLAFKYTRPAYGCCRRGLYDTTLKLPDIQTDHSGMVHVFDTHTEL